MSEQEQADSGNADTNAKPTASVSANLDPNKEPTSQEREKPDNQRDSFLKKLRNLLTDPKALLEIIGLAVLITYTHYAGQQAESARVSAEAAKTAAESAQGALTETRIGREHAAREAQHARELTATQTQEGIEASTQQNMATLDVNIEASRNDQRAWLGVTDFKLTKEPVIGEDTTVTFSIQNTGKTPALKVAVRTAMAIQSGEMGVPDWGLFGQTPTNAILFPGMSIRDVTAKIDSLSVTREALVPYSIMQLVPNEIDFRIRLDYDDVFGRSHWTQACGRHKPATALDKFDQCLVGIGVDPPTETHRK